MFQLFIYWVYDSILSWSLGWDFIFVYWSNKTHLCRFSVHWRKKNHIRNFSAVVYKEGSFNSWRIHIFHSAQSYFPFQVFFIEKPCPSDNRRGGTIHNIPTCFNTVFNTNKVIISWYVVFILSIYIIVSFPQLLNLIAIFSTVFLSSCP